MKIILSLVISVLFFLLILQPIQAEEDEADFNQFITIVNPVRISAYTIDPKGNVISQYQEVKNRKLSATWLLTYDVLINPDIYFVIQNMDQNQEIGLFLEITPKLASDSGVLYNKTDSWHRATSLFLSGYTQKERLKFINTLFEKYKSLFGFYPQSVGAWWIDSFSLEYMKTRFGIISNLTVADQFSTDGYQIWGQYWSTPFYPSKYHAGIPAIDNKNKLDVVTIQWAPRDPLNGYGTGGASLYSTQDYFTIVLTDDYFRSLVELYAKKHNNKFGHITVGLEGDLSPQAYKGIYSKQLDIIKQFEVREKIKVVTMKDFANWYRLNFPEVSPVHIIDSLDILDSGTRSIWFNSPHYRINLIYDLKTTTSTIKDLRIYTRDFQEPYFISPNRDLNLKINIPSQLDFASYPEEGLKIKGKLIDTAFTDNGVTLKFEEEKSITFLKDRIKFAGFKIDLPKSLERSALTKIENGNTFITKTDWPYPPQGLIFRDLTIQSTHFLKQKKIILLSTIILLLLMLLVGLIWKSKKTYRFKAGSISGIVLLLIGFIFVWYLKNSQYYYVSQSELDVLLKLSLLPGNRIVVYDSVCLQCSWHTAHIPAIFANKRDYVRKTTRKDIIYNSSIFNAKTRPEAKQELDKLNADYVYLVRFEDYVETAPFSPGDLNIEEIYSNANAQIWKVKKD